ncbi:hypothetical protein SAMN05216353_11160 [Halobacillus alkaliphilus]|uniref:Uncharacterized protein n=1 Tax=Halobacillus alkaliphilus TaxID=396056 RepID=A0A1I2M4E4_9BACI|nr:hypothetical protein [Halobacillus alkaliphilus]SFF86402.1 hypothetical protein SAMN05216353_11160 [Halobacillus alkaliphilus]
MTTATFIGFLPIVFIAVLIWLFLKMNQKSGRTRRKYLPSKTSVWVFGGYVSLLLVSFILFFFIPERNASPETSDGNISETGRELYQKVLAGEVTDINDKYLREEWRFDYEYDRLEIGEEIEEPSALTIVVDQTNDSEKIEASFYSTPASLQGMVLNHDLPLKIGVADRHLDLLLTQTIDRTFTVFSPAFPFTQFTEEKDGMMEGDMEWGTNILYVSVPKDINVSSDYHSVEYVKE